MSIFKKFFSNEEALTEKDVKYAKFSFIVEGSCGATVSNTVGGAYLAALFSFLGATETQNNFIISLSSFAMFFGLFAPLLTKHAKFYKPFNYICKLIAYTSAGLVFLLPLIAGANLLSLVLGAILFFVFQTVINIQTPTYNVWYMNTISADGKNPGVYMGIKSMIGFASMIASMLLIAELFKIYTGERQIYFFVIIGAMVLVLTAIIAALHFPVKEAPLVKKDENNSSLRNLLDMFRDKSFAPFLRANTIHLSSISLIAALLNIFTVQRLGIGLDILSYMTILDFGLRGVFSPICGRLMTTFGAKKILVFSHISVAISHGIFAFMTPENYVALKIVSSFFMGIGYAAHGVASIKYMFEVMPPEKSTSYIAGSSALSGITGYLASLVATFVIGVANGASFSLLGISFSEMQILFIISMIFSLISVFFLYSSKKTKSV